MNLLKLEKKVIQMRMDVVNMIHTAGSGHVGSALSCLEILVALYYGKFGEDMIMNVDPKKPGWDKQDYCILSKGNACPSQYAILADMGFFPKDELAGFRKEGRLLQAYPTRRIPGIMHSAGPYADGFAFACGLAVALQKEKVNNKIFTILSDAEMQEGIVYEAALMAAHHHCDNLVAIVDASGMQVDGYIRGVLNVEPLSEKFRAAGWKVYKVLDGHNLQDLVETIQKAVRVNGQPVCILAETISAKGIPFAEGKPGYFAASLSEAELNELMPLLEKELDDLGI